MRIFAILLTAGLLIAAPATARPGKDTWYLVSVSQNFSEALLIDVTSLKTLQGSTRSASIEVVGAVAARPGDVGSISAQVVFNCAANTVQVTEASSYDLNGQVLKTTTAEKETTPAPGSRGEMELKFVCSEPAAWDKSRIIDEGAVGGSITDYARFMLQGMMIDAVEGGVKK